MEDFGARIANMEAAQGETERKPRTKTDSNRVGEVFRQDVDTMMESRSNTAIHGQSGPSQAQVMDDHEHFVDEGDETPDEMASEALWREPKNLAYKTVCLPSPDSYYTNQRSHHQERNRKQSRTNELYE